MKTQNIKWNWLAASAIALAFTCEASALTTAQEGLDHLKSNLLASQTNLLEYQTHQKVSEGNLSEVSKARAEVDKMRSEIAQSSGQAIHQLKVFEKTDAELHLLIETEKKEVASVPTASDDAKILEAKHAANLASYQEQQKQLSSDQAQWKLRIEQLSKLQHDLDAKAKALATQENEWKTKVQTDKVEVARWQKEVEREQKLNENYRSLADVKD